MALHRWESTYLDTVAELDAVDPADELCCVFARDWTAKLYGADVVKRAPTALWMLYPLDPKIPDSGDPWGPVSACFRAGIASDDVHDLIPGRWHRVQGWRGVPFAKGVSGHTITVYAGKRHAIVYDSAKDPRGARVTLVVWADYVAQFTGGVAIAVLEEP